MSGRSALVRGFRLSVEAPDRIGRLARRALGRKPPAGGGGGGNGGDGAMGRLIVEPTSAVPFERRDPAAGLVFVQARLDWRAAHHRDPPPDEVEDDPAALARLVAGRPWYHTLELPHGIVSVGAYDHRPLVPHYGIPADLRGKRVLDLASADGFWAFEFERRGAEVTALDIDTTREVDLPGPVRQWAAEHGLVDPITDGFHLAKRVLKSGVEHVTGTIYDLDPGLLGQFDLVHAGDVLLHLRDPLGALEQIRRVTRGQALLSDVFEPTLAPAPGAEGLPALYFGGGNAAWWRPSLPTLVQMVADAGFADVAVLTTYNLAARGEPSGPWRAVVRATA